VSAEYRGIAPYLSSAAKAKISAENCDIAADLAVLLQHHAASEDGDVGGDVSAYPDIAAETDDFADLLVGADRDVMSELCEIAVSESRGGKQRYKEQTDGKPA